MLRESGCRVTVVEEYDSESCDLLLALHARKSARSIVRFHAAEPHRPLILVLTGTDLYGDLRNTPAAHKSLQLATRILLLQSHGLRYVPRRYRAKARVIYQSATPPDRANSPRKNVFQICVIGHLRPVKDPFRAALAARQLPDTSRIRIVHIGGALSSTMEQRARREMDINPRYQWLGEMSYARTKQHLARCRLLVLSSKMEGGANVISEAIVAGVPVVASRISGSVGLLGEDYPGLFEVGDTQGLAQLLSRAETDPDFLAELGRRCAARRHLFSPERERAAWRRLLDELSGGNPGHN